MTTRLITTVAATLLSALMLVGVVATPGLAAERPPGHVPLQVGVFVADDGRVSAITTDSIGALRATPTDNRGDGVSTTGPTQDMHFSWGWVTGTMYFNRTETGYATSTAWLAWLASAVLPVPFGSMVAGGVAYYASMAGIVRAQGKCLAIKTTGMPYGYTGKWCS